MLARAAGEVEDQPLALDARVQAQEEIALAPLEHVLGVDVAVGQLRDARSGAPLGVVEHGAGRLAQPLDAEPLGERAQALGADAIGGELGAQVGAPLLGLAHLHDELLDRRVVERARRDHDALLGQRAAVGGHRARHAPADVGVMGAAGGEAEQRPLVGGEHGRDHGDVGQVRAAAERIVEDPRDAWRVALAEHRGDRGGHRAEVHRDVLGLHDHLPVGVEQAGRGVVSLLDVRRVARSGSGQRPSLRRRRAARP